MPKLPHTTFGDLPAQSLVNGNFPVGSGISTHHFLMQAEDTWVNALSIVQRQGPDYIPSSFDDVQHGGTYNVPAGLQPGHPSTVIWNFNLDFSSGRIDQQKFLLNHDEILNVHMNGTPVSSDLHLHAVYAPDVSGGSSPIIFANDAGIPVIIDNGGGDKIVANSENVKFFFPGYNGADATFQIDTVITKFEAGNHTGTTVISDIHDTVIVGSGGPAEAPVSLVGVAAVHSDHAHG